MTQVNAIKQQLLRQGYRGAQTSKPQLKQVMPNSRSRTKPSSEQYELGPAAILELSPEARELIQVNH